MSWTFLLRGEEATALLARRLATRARVNDVFLLVGDVGAGKSVFARAFVRAVAASDTLRVTSPTFKLANEYALERLKSTPPPSHPALMPQGCPHGPVPAEQSPVRVLPLLRACQKCGSRRRGGGA